MLSVLRLLVFFKHLVGSNFVLGFFLLRTSHLFCLESAEAEDLNSNSSETETWFDFGDVCEAFPSSSGQIDPS